MTGIDRRRWIRFCDEHGPDFASTVHIPGLVTDPVVLESGLRDALRSATTRVGEEDRTEPRIRVYSGHRLDYPAAERLTHSGFDGTDLHRWFDTVCPDDMCLAFNEIDTWSPDLADLLTGDIAEPMADTIGDPRAGIEWYSFIARSGWTPFGLHSDPESSMIFHLGPAPKEVWIWEQDVLRELADGRRITFDFEPHLPAARHVVLQPGDFLSIPAFHFHIFRNTGFAAFLGLTIFPQDIRQELANLVLHLAPRPPSGHHQPDAARAAIGDAATALTSDPLLADRVTTLLDAQQARLRSTGWSKPLARPVTPTAADAVAGTRFLVTRRPVVLGRDGNRPVLHGGGRTIKLPHGTAPDRLRDALPPGESVTGDTLLAALQAALADTSTDPRHLVRALETCGVVRATTRDAAS